MKKLKNFGVSIIALIVVVALSIGITLAILSTTSNDKSNVFTGVGGIKLTATEPEWESTGKDLAEKYYPGLEIPKDPILTNTSTDDNSVDEYAAMRLDYQVKHNSKWYSISKTDFDKIAKVQYKSGADTYTDGFNTTDWEVATASEGIESNTFFYYKKDGGVLAKSATTTTLFDRVVIQEKLESSDITTSTEFTFTGTSYTGETLDGATTNITITGFPQFRIVVKGVAVQSLEAGDYATAKTSLNTLYPTKLEMLKVAE